ncbi:diguanylate cyclase [Vibrio kyushuensis]|uniref:sensor domain-containing diguanylate cyclase n=1 Tax=Vibrio kyushuensis TaxID=2910249 RepID=UPI003D0ADC84
MTKFISQQFISAKSVITIISWLFSAMAIAVVGFLIYFLSSLDNLATLELNQRMDLALKLENQHRASLLEEYTYWDETYNMAIIDQDTLWIEENTGGYLLDSKGFDFSVAITQGTQKAYLVSSDEIKAPSFDDIMKQGLIQMMEQSKTLNTRTKTTSGYFLLGDSLYVVVGGPLIEEDTGITRDGTYLALGTLMDRSELTVFAKNHQIFDLKLILDTEPQQYGTAIIAPNGEKIGTFTWKPYLPSKEIIPYVTLVVITFSLITIFVTRLILMREQTNRAAYEEKLFLEATQDSLTKIINRRYFWDIGRKEFALYRNESSSFSVVILDIDHFKQINDQHGHSVGDKALVHFTQICNQGLRDTDIFGRVGGEEFAIILPNTNSEKALAVTNRIRTLLVDNPMGIHPNEIKMTVSIGVAVIDNNSSFDSLIEQADIALYQAKESGRNRVTLYRPNSEPTEP